MDKETKELAKLVFSPFIERGFLFGVAYGITFYVILYLVWWLFL